MQPWNVVAPLMAVLFVMTIKHILGVLYHTLHISAYDSVRWVRLMHVLQGSWWWTFNLNMEDIRLAQLLSGNVRVFLGVKAPWWCRLHYWK